MRSSSQSVARRMAGGRDGDGVRARLDAALEAFRRHDLYLLEHDLSERCIASRLALHLQQVFSDHIVDVEYNRDGLLPKRLGIDDECANAVDENGLALVVPDIVVHRRGKNGPNLLVIEMKKQGDRRGIDCDRERVIALREAMNYTCGALVACETRKGHEPAISVVEWFS